MDVTLLGTGAAWPDADRSAPAFHVQHENISILIDCGGGTPHQLMKAGISPSKIDTILFTHIHIDHCVEFPSLIFGAYLTGKEGSFDVYGPEGTRHFTESIFKDTYDFAAAMMKKIRDKDINFVTKEINGGLVLKSDGLVVEAQEVEHGIPTLAYKITANGKSVVFSGDTAPCDGLKKLAQDADLLVIECSFPEATGPKPGHLIPSQVGKLAQESNVKKVVLVHLFPTCKGKESGMVADVKKLFDGPVEVGTDLQRFTL